ncbi:hypothetical protein ACLESD_19295 [Pyxidicoccus sp. 3LFB2]
MDDDLVGLPAEAGGGRDDVGEVSRAGAGPCVTWGTSRTPLTVAGSPRCPLRMQRESSPGAAPSQPGRPARSSRWSVGVSCVGELPMSRKRDRRY